jgi:hypothetical protein
VTVGLVNLSWAQMAMPKSNYYPGIGLRERRPSTRRRAGDVDRLLRLIQFTLFTVAQGNGHQKFQAARRSYR